MSRYVTVGFDRDTDAEKFKTLVTEAGHTIKIYHKIPDGESTKAVVTSVGIRSIFDNNPVERHQRFWETFGVIVEFKDQRIALKFMQMMVDIMASSYQEESYAAFFDLLTTLVSDTTVAGLRMEKP